MSILDDSDLASCSIDLLRDYYYELADRFKLCKIKLSAKQTVPVLITHYIIDLSLESGHHYTLSWFLRHRQIELNLYKAVLKGIIYLVHECFCFLSGQPLREDCSKGVTS